MVDLTAGVWDNRWVAKTSSSKGLGQRLRELREGHDWSLRDVAARAGINHGYLSQLERGEVAEPSPSMLHKIATAYEVEFTVLMRWAGYIEGEGAELTPKQALALSYLGDDISDEDLKAVRAVLNAIRAQRATLASDSGSLDHPLSPQSRLEIRRHVESLLRHADALGVVPTPLEQVLEVAELVVAGEIVLDEAEKRQLRKKFGGLVDLVLAKLRGAIHLRAREIWVQPDLYESKRRFVTAHEIGHDLLPWQRDTIAYLDDAARLRPDIRIHFEREANQAAIELLAQGDLLRKEADDSVLSTSLLSDLSVRFEISLQAVARRVVEETKQDAAVALKFRGERGGVGPFHVYCSASFEKRFGWAASAALPTEARTAAYSASKSTDSSTTCLAVDLSSTFVEMRVSTVTTPFALLALYLPAAKATSLRRWLHVG